MKIAAKIMQGDELVEEIAVEAPTEDKLGEAIGELIDNYRKAGLGPELFEGDIWIKLEGV